MTHKIFISQGTLELGRDRNNRRLEAKMDNRTLKDKPEINCIYYSYCKTRLFGRINCLFEQKYCQTFKYYERYGQ